MNLRFPHHAAIYDSCQLVCTLYTDLSPQSWANCEKIATTHHLAKHVRVTQVATMLHLPTYSSFKEFEEDHQELLGRESE